MHDHMMKRIEENGGFGVNKGKHFSEIARQHNRDAQRKIADHHRQMRLGKKLGPETIAKRTAKRLENNGGVYTLNTTSKMVRCVETGQKFQSIASASRKLGVSAYIITSRIDAGRDINGLHYEYLNKGEMTDGISISESQKNSNKD